MTDWIQVLLGQPLEEAREDSLEELNQAAEGLQIRKRQSMRRAAAREEEMSGPAADGTGAAGAAPRTDLWTEARAWDRSGRAGPAASGGGRPGQAETAWTEETPDRTADGEERIPSGHGAAQLDRALQKTPMVLAEPGRKDREEEPPEAASAGAQAARAGQAEAQVWRQSGAEFLEAESAGGQAEWAAAETARRQSSGYLAAALAAPEYRTPAAGRLLAAMERNDRAASYQTTARIAEQTENSAWTGSGPIQLDQFFERDARRYDNGFTMF